MKDEVETRISPDGLRYVSKAQGSAFPAALGYTMSCYLCGRHRPRTHGFVRHRRHAAVALQGRVLKRRQDGPT